ncbi:MAG: hypothetical protein U1F76_12505 [Candidatus Competibacteraceae bacterium]
MSRIGSRRRWLLSGLGTVLLSSILAGYLLTSRRPDLPIVVDEGEIHPIVIGLTYTEFFREKPRKKIVAQALVIKPRPLLFFNVKGIREAMLVNAQTDLYSYDDVSLSQVELFPFTEEQEMSMAWVKNLLEQYGPVTRLVIESLTLSIHHDADLQLVLHAKRAIQQGKDSPWLLEDIVLWHPKTGKHILSNEVFWDQQKQLFRFVKPYLLIMADGQRQKQKPGRLNLELQPVNP